MFSDQQIWSLAYRDKSNNDDIKDSDQEGEQDGCVVQLGRLDPVLLHVDVQCPLHDETKTHKDLENSALSQPIYTLYFKNKII